MSPKDHDTLIKVQTNQEVMCKKIALVLEKLDKIDDKIERKVSWKVYVWSMTAGLGVLGFYGKLLYDIIKGA